MNGSTSTPEAAAEGFDAFLSYNSSDYLAVEEIGRQLQSQGLRPFLDRWYLGPGLRWQPRLERVLATCHAVVVFCGPEGLGSWQQREVDVALDRQSKDETFPVIPVLLPGGVPPLGFLKQNTWVDYSMPDLGVAMLAKAIRHEPFDPDLQKRFTAIRASICPYRGLLHFREEDAAFFFGRDQTIQSLTTAVRQKNLLAVVGASGSGKSSVVRAGLVPQLRRDREITWEVATLKPGDQPLKALAAALIPFLEPQLNVREHLEEVGNYAKSFLSGKLQLADVVEKLIEKQPGTDRLLLIVDQWEELYTSTSDAEVRRRFIDELLDASASGRERLKVVLTLRGDFMGKALAYRPLCDRLQDSQLNLGPMSRAELEQAVNRPAVEVGLSFEPGLSTRLLDDAGDEPGNLPLLEFVLERLWKERHHGQFLHDAYDRMGGLHGAIADRAERLYTNLNSSDQAAIHRLFLQLVRPGQGDEYTRRRVQLDGKIQESSAHLIKRLADERLLVTTKSAEAEETVEVAHEALIQHWKTLKEWLAADRDFLAWRERLRGAVDQWEKAGKVKDAFLRGAVLKEADAWRERREADFSDRERRFISSSLAYRERLLRLKVSGFAAAALVGAVLASVASLGWRRAEEQRHIAMEQTQKAVAARLVAQAEPLLSNQDNKLQHVALLAVESMRRLPGAEADQLLRRALKLLPRPISNMAHEAAVAAVAYSPNGRYLISASSDAAQLWNATNGARLGAPAKHGSNVNAVVFSPDGQFFATASQDKTARLWETATGREVGVAKPHPRGVAQVVFSPNGRGLATLSYDNVIRIWSTNSGGLVEASLTNKAIVKAIAFGPEAKTLAVACNDGFARLLDFTKGQEIANVKHGGVVRSVAFNRTGELLATAGEDGAARVWQAAKGGTIWVPLTKVLHQGAVVAVVFSPDGQRLATASHDYTARVWDTQTGRELARMIHDKEVAAVGFSPDGNHLATASDYGTARTWEITGYSEFRRKGAGAEIKAVAFSPNGRYFAAAGRDQTARLYEITTGKDMTNFVHNGPVTAIAFSQDGHYLATACGGRSGAAWVWDLTSGQRANYFAQTTGVATVAFTKDGHYLALGCDNGLVSVLAMPAGNIVCRTSHAKTVSSIVFSPDQKKMATACADSIVRLYDLAACQEVLTVMHGGSVNAVCYSPRGDYLATASTDKSARIWDAVSGNLVAQFNHESGAFAVAFSPDGRHLAVAVGDGTARVWEWRKDQEIARVTHDREVASIAFSPDGRYLATGSVDGTVRLWLWQHQDLINETCSRLTRNFTTNEWQQYFGTGADAEHHRKTCPNLP